MKFKQAIFIPALLLLTACPSNNTKPLTDSSNDYGKTVEEQSLFQKSDDMLAEFKRKGLILENDPISNYVSAVGRSVVPTKVAGITDFRFYVIRDPQINAFATANGMVFVNLGLLSRLDSELQLAQVLSHEVGHVVERHVYETYEATKSKIRAAHFTDLALFGTGIAYIPFAASIMSHGREKEIAADEFAFNVLGQKGYKVSEATKLFNTISEVKRAELVEGSIWSSHPGNKEREERYKKLISSNTSYKGTRIGKAEYMPIRKAAVLQNVELKLIMKEYSLAAESVERELKYYPSNAKLYYLKGEAYRKMAEDPKGAAREYAWVNDKKFKEEMITEFEAKKANHLKLAEAAYRNAIVTDPNFAKAYRGKGLTHLQLGNKSQAYQDLSSYLNSGSNIRDKRYITKLLEDIRNEN